MVLLDHFRPPLSIQRHWHSFHNAWATYLAEDLNQQLPAGYFAEPNVQFGIEIDVAALSEGIPLQMPRLEQNRQWTLQSPTATVLFQPTTDIIEVQVFSSQAGPTLVGAIELVSPANKDRPVQRDAFTAKCQTYLQQGIGLVMVDVVTTLSANLHDQLINRLNLPVAPMQTGLYAVAYRIAETNQTPQLDLWQESLAVGAALPSLPLFLKGGFYLPLNLNHTYGLTCRRQRLVESEAAD